MDNNYEIISDISSNDFRDYITNEIFWNWKWGFTMDDAPDTTPHYRKEAEGRMLSDTGCVITSFCDERTPDQNDYHFKLNNFAEYLSKAILKRTKWEYSDLTLRRYCWNYYNAASSGVWHTDYVIGRVGTQDHNGNTKNHLSVLYNFSDDGATIIKNGDEEIYIPSVPGEAILFDSFAEHRGVGPLKSEKRFALNMVFSYSERTLR
mgnify:CR=1 FL=1